MNYNIDELLTKFNAHREVANEHLAKVQSLLKGKITQEEFNAYEKNQEEKKNAFMNALYEAVDKYSEGKVSHKQVDMIITFMYENDEDTYYGTNGATNFMCYVFSIVDIIKG